MLNLRFAGVLFCEMLVAFCVFSCYTQFCKKFVCEVVFLWNKMNIQKAL